MADAQPQTSPAEHQAMGAYSKKSRVLNVVRGLASEDGAAQFERLIHERLRLAIVSALAASDRLTFKELKLLLQTSDGNLSVHARKLEEAGYISVHKFFEGRTPKTEFALTKRGRAALEKYLDHMEDLLRAMRPK